MSGNKRLGSKSVSLRRELLGWVLFGFGFLSFGGWCGVLFWGRFFVCVCFGLFSFSF